MYLLYQLRLFSSRDTARSSVHTGTVSSWFSTKVTSELAVSPPYFFTWSDMIKVLRNAIFWQNLLPFSVHTCDSSSLYSGQDLPCPNLINYVYRIPDRHPHVWIRLQFSLQYRDSAEFSTAWWSSRCNLDTNIHFPNVLDDGVQKLSSTRELEWHLRLCVYLS